MAMFIGIGTTEPSDVTFYFEPKSSPGQGGWNQPGIQAHYLVLFLARVNTTA